VAGATPLPAAAATAPAAPYFPGEVVVRFRASADGPERTAVRQRVGATIQRTLAHRNTQLVGLDDGRTVADAVAALERDPHVLYAEPNYRVESDAAAPNDPMFGAQWNLDRIEAPAAWAQTVGSRDVTVAVLDGGVEVRHPDLAGASPAESNLWTRAGETSERDGSGHGTAAAGVVGAIGDNGIGPTGVNQRVRIMPLAAFSNGSAGLADAIAYADAHGVRMANGSFGIPWSQAMEDALAAAPGLLLSVSAGNNGWNVDEHPEERYPCVSTLPNVICVAASGQDDDLAGWSNWSERTVDLAAPGVDIPTLRPPDRWIRIDDFESELGDRWVTGGTGVAWSRTQTASEWGYGGTWMLDDSAGQPYANDSDSWIAMTGSVDLTGYSGCIPSMGVDTRLASGDVLRLEASNADTPWKTVMKWEGSPVFEREPMTDFEGRPGMRLRFRLTTNASGQNRGARIDSLGLYCIDPPFRGDEYLNTAGTSFAAPHVAGVGALVLSREPHLTTAQLRARLLDSVDPKPGLAGRTVTGGRLNARRALGEAAPAPGGAPAATETVSPSGPGSGSRADRSAPKCRLRVQRRRDLAGLRRRGLRLSVNCDEPARLSAGLLVRGRRVGGVAASVDPAKGRSLHVAVRPRFAKLLRAGRVPATVELVAKDRAGNKRSVTKRLLLRR
jgi:subtilisin family serine protease